MAIQADTIPALPIDETEIFTNRRFFQVPTKTDFSYRNSIAQICYGDCKSLAIKGRSLVARHRDGRQRGIEDQRKPFIPAGPGKIASSDP